MPEIPLAIKMGFVVNYGLVAIVNHLEFAVLQVVDDSLDAHLEFLYEKMLFELVGLVEEVFGEFPINALTVLTVLGFGSVVIVQVHLPIVANSSVRYVMSVVAVQWVGFLRGDVCLGGLFDLAYGAVLDLIEPVEDAVVEFGLLSIADFLLFRIVFIA